MTRTAVLSLALAGIATTALAEGKPRMPASHQAFPPVEVIEHDVETRGERAARLDLGRNPDGRQKQVAELPSDCETR